MRAPTASSEMKRWQISITVLASLLLPQPGYADDTALWKKMQNWAIYVDKSLNYGCFMFGAYTHGDVLRIGFDRKNSNGYVVLGNDAWKSLEIGKEYSTTLKFDDDSPWSGTAKAITLSTNVPLLYFPFSDTNFLNSIAVKQGVTVFYSGKIVTYLPLTGSFAAVQELVNCQTQFSDQTSGLQSKDSGSEDPFKAPAPASSDPFSK